MSNYKIEISKEILKGYEKLSHKRTMELLDLYQKTKKQQYKDILVLSNIKLVLSLSQKYNQKMYQLEDLFQVGIIGLIKAIENFNTSLQVKFSTYAVPLIIGEMKRFNRDNSSLKIPRSTRDIAYKIMLFNEEYMKEYHHEASIEDISAHLKIDSYTVEEAILSTNSLSSLSQEVQNDGNGSIDLESQIPDRKKNVEDINTMLELHDALQRLNKREYHIIDERYFQGVTQSELAKELVISQAQVSRIEKQALKHLRQYMSS